MKPNRTTLHTLPSGLRIAHRRCPGAPVDYCGVLVFAGSRNDLPDQPGMAHFVEHTLFKGTARRRSWHIINRMERVGGELNAYTTKEETVVYCAAPAGNLARATELIADLVINSRFPQAELDKEREVVADEINSYLDSPADAVFDDFEDLAFAGTPLGHNILGNIDALRSFDSKKCRVYLESWYTAPNMVFFYCGASSAERVIDCVARNFESLPVTTHARTVIPASRQMPAFNVTRDIETHQAHTVMGCAAGGFHSSDRHTLALITNILGGPGMNSLLNIALREKRGLVYSVEAALARMSDCGLFTVYFGCDPHDTGKCISLVNEQIEKLATVPMSQRALAAARRQYLGQIAVASDNRESLAIATARNVLHYNRVPSSAETKDIIESITPEQIMSTASTLTKLSMLTLK